MRELNLTEIETVSGGETVMEPIIVVGRRPEPIMMEHSYGDVWADCQTAANGALAQVYAATQYKLVWHHNQV